MPPSTDVVTFTPKQLDAAAHSRGQTAGEYTRDALCTACVGLLIPARQLLLALKLPEGAEQISAITRELYALAHNMMPVTLTVR